jgi:hypothetical protein
MRTQYIKSIGVVLLFLTLSCGARAASFHFPVGLTYASGIQDASDKLFDFYENDGYNVDRITIPVGLTFNPYFEWDNGIGAGLSVGPTTFVIVEENTYSYYSSSSDTKFSYAVPVGPFVRYTFLKDKNVSPYIKAGVKYPFAGGDNFGSSTIGPFGAIGVDFWRTKSVGMSVEFGYDGSRLKVKYQDRFGDELSKKVNFPGFTASVSVLF